jgi:hypothetical protein
MEYQIAKPGEIIRVTRKGHAHNYTVGELYRVREDGDNDRDSLQAESLNGEWKGNYLYHDCYEITNPNRQYYTDKIAQLNSELIEAAAILKWMDEAGVDEYDVMQYKVWQVLTAMDDASLTKAQKMREIVELWRSTIK